MNDIKILLYHSVGKVDPQDELGTRVEKQRFFDQMRFLRDNNYNVCMLRDAVNYIKNKKVIPKKSVAITFDDGYKDNLLNAAPIMEEFNIWATFFVTVSYIGRIKTSPKRIWQHWKCMDLSDLKRLIKRGHDIESHSMHHVDLTKLDATARRAELSLSKRALESLLNIKIDFFSYPYGYFDKELQEEVGGEGYKAACSTVTGGNTETTGLYELRRIEIAKTDTLGDFSYKITHESQLNS